MIKCGKDKKRSSMNVTENEEKHSMIWGMFMSVTLESAVFMRKNYLDNCHSITNTKDLTLKQMFDISTRLVSEQDEISGLETIGWENHSWKYMYLIGDERVINLQRTNFYIFSDSVLCLGKIQENTQSNDAWEPRLEWFKSSPENRNFDRIDGEPMEFEWNIFPGFTTLQLSDKVKSLLLRLDETPENFTGIIIFMSMSITFLVDQKTTKKYAWQMPNSYLCTQGDLEKDNGHSLVLVLKKSGTLSVSLQGEWDNMAERMMLEFAESGCPIFRAASPLSRGRLKKAKAVENCRYTIVPIWERLRLCFA